MLRRMSFFGGLRKLYRAYFSRYRVFRYMKRIMLGIYFAGPIDFSRLQILLESRQCRLPLRSASEFTREYGIRKEVVRESAPVQVPALMIPGRYAVGVAIGEMAQFVEPSIEVIEVQEATVIGGTNIFICRDCAVHPDVLKPDRDEIPAEQFRLAAIDVPQRMIEIRLSRWPQKIDRAISLVGQCTGNYAHWLTETLPKLVIIDEFLKYNDVPLLVDSWIHPNFYRSIELFSVNRRPIFRLGRWRAAKVGMLIDVSPPAYAPAEFRGYRGGKALPPPQADWFLYSKWALNRLRDTAEKLVPPVDRRFSKRVYLLRTVASVGNRRFIRNLSEVHKIISSYGFVGIDPASLTLEEQIAMFRGATCIVSAVGAALANAVFTPPGCHVIALASYHENANYYYFGNLMAILGHNLHYVLGAQVGTDGHIAHRDFEIDVSSLHEALSAVPF